MRSCRLLVLCALVLAVRCLPIETGAAAVIPFAVKATIVTMPSITAIKTSGGVTSVHLGSSQITVTGIPGPGTLTIGCQYSGPAIKAKIPRQCGPVGAQGSPVTAGETFTTTVYFVPFDQGPIPSLSQLRRAPAVPLHPAVAALALAGALMLGFGFRRKTPR